MSEKAPGPSRRTVGNVVSAGGTSGAISLGRIVEMEKQTYASTTESEFRGWCLNRSTLVTDMVTVPALAMEMRPHGCAADDRRGIHPLRDGDPEAGGTQKETSLYINCQSEPSGDIQRGAHGEIVMHCAAAGARKQADR